MYFFKLCIIRIIAEDLVSKRETTYVSEEEIRKQQDYINLVKNRNRNKNPKYCINTFGCQMNENDTEKLSGMLQEMGYTETQNQDESDLIIFNTCCVREHAELKVYSRLGLLKKLKEKKPGLIIAVCGCMMQQKDVVEKIRREYQHVSLVFGTHNLYRFPEMLNNVLETEQRILDIQETTGSIAEGLPIQRKDGVKAWVTIMYGCDNFCSYCIVPYVRGRERSRRIADISDEVSRLGREGYKEITLLGQNVNSYGKDLADANGNTVSFADLLRHLNNSDNGIERIRFLTSHPKDLSDDVIKVISEGGKICEYLHLPIQSGSNRILELMNRRYTREYYIDLVNKIRKHVPGIAITTDIITGFPGETEEDFEDTLDLVETVRFDSAYTFLYSRRTGTPAASMPDQVPEDIKKARFYKLVDLQNRISREINEELKGKELEVLVEGISKTNPDTYTGRTRTNKIVNFKGHKEMIGKLVTVKIDKIQTWSLSGKVL